MHALALDVVARRLHTDIQRGLCAGEAAKRSASDGPNEIVVAPPRSAWLIFARQFRSLLVALLGVAMVIALALGDRVEALAIVVVILLNAVLGFVTEHKARLGVVVNNDVAPRLYEEDLIGLPFTHL